MTKNNFEKLLLEAVDEGLSSLGESSRQAIYFHIDKQFNIKHEEIPCKVEAFAEAIESIFGMGADFLEVLIMQRLHKKTKQEVKWQESKDLTFSEYVATIKQGFAKERKTRKTSTVFVDCAQIITDQ